MVDQVEVAEPYRRLLEEARLDGIDAAFRYRDGERLDKPGLAGWRQRWRLRLPGGSKHAGTLLYLKRFLAPPLSSQWERWRQGWWRASTARIEWENSRTLAGLNIPATRAVACGQRMVGPWERCSYLLLEEVAGESLEKWVPAHLPPLGEEPEPAVRRRKLDELASLVGAFHAAGFVHRDLYLCHVFLKPDGGFCLIDLQRVFRPRWRRRRWMVKDLAALHLSTPAECVGRGERLRFLCRYLRTCGLPEDARRLLRSVERKTRRMAR